MKVKTINGTRKVLVYSNKKEIPYSTWWQRQLRRKLVKKFGGKCKDCDTDKNLQFAHTKPTELSGEGRGTWNRLADVRDHPKSYSLRCPPCHRDYDDS